MSRSADLDPYLIDKPVLKARQGILSNPVSLNRHLKRRGGRSISSKRTTQRNCKSKSSCLSSSSVSQALIGYSALKGEIDLLRQIAMKPKNRTAAVDLREQQVAKNDLVLANALQLQLTELRTRHLVKTNQFEKLRRIVRVKGRCLKGPLRSSVEVQVIRDEIRGKDKELGELAYELEFKNRAIEELLRKSTRATELMQKTQRVNVKKNIGTNGPLKSVPGITLGKKWSIKDEILSLYNPRDGSVKPPRNSLIVRSLKHISLNAQLNKIEKSELLEFVFGDLENYQRITADSLTAILQYGPAKVKNREEARELSKFLISHSDHSIKEVALKLLKYTDNWRLFSHQIEEELDNRLFLIIYTNKASFKAKCKSLDPNETGFIPRNAFLAILKEVEPNLPNEIAHYLELLFYSHSYDLYNTPYAHLIRSYTQPVDEYETEEQENASIVRGYLELIARSLLKRQKTIQEVFLSKNGLILPDDFTKGVADLEIGFEPGVVALLIKSLQYSEQAERVCISLEELEDLFEYYGVAKEDRNSLNPDRSFESLFIRDDSSLEKLSGLQFQDKLPFKTY